MEKVNVLIMGNSGVGKSTLINSVFNCKEAEVGTGTAVTKKMKIHESEEVNFRIIDTVGLEYGFITQVQTKNEIKNWSKKSVKNKAEGEYIHIIWYCIDATSKRFFDKNLDSLKNVARMWKNVPILILLTKSYSDVEVDENIKMVKKVLENYKGNKHLNVYDILPVIAQQFPVNNDMIITPHGISELIERTYEIIPESLRLNKEAVLELELKIKKTESNALVVAATTGAGAVGAIPIPIADSIILAPLQVGMVKGIMKIYDFKRDEKSNALLEILIGGTLISGGAKMLLSGLKGIPGINLAAAVLNAFVAASITATLGEVTIALMDKIGKGELEASDIEVIQKFVESEFIKKANTYLSKISENIDAKDFKNVGEFIAKIFSEFNK